MRHAGYFIPVLTLNHLFYFSWSSLGFEQSIGDGRFFMDFTIVNLVTIYLMMEVALRSGSVAARAAVIVYVAVLALGSMKGSVIGLAALAALLMIAPLSRRVLPFAVTAVLVTPLIVPFTIGDAALAELSRADFNS